MNPGPARTIANLPQAPSLPNCHELDGEVVAIYAGTRGYLDKLAITEVGPFQEQLIAHMKASHQGILDDVVAKGAIDDAADKSMKEIFTKFTAEFSA